MRNKCCETTVAETGGGISDEEVYAGKSPAVQAADRLSTSGSEVEATTETNVEGQQHSVKAFRAEFPPGHRLVDDRSDFRFDWRHLRVLRRG